MKLYLYCLAEKIDALAAPISGVAGARVELSEIEGFSILVSEFSGDSVPPVTRDNVMAHAAVVSSALNQTTPLPFRFGTVVDDEQLRSYITSHKAALDGRLAQVRGCVEMSVKIIWNTDKNEINERAETIGEGPGAKFLKEKRREILGGERRTEKAKEVAAWLKEQTATCVHQEEVSLSPTDKLIVAAAHLIRREQLTEYRDLLTEARKTRPELHFLVSGPWPPYTFSNIELEFKTRFGVS
jgi:hypothetical protein